MTRDFPRSANRAVALVLGLLLVACASCSGPNESTSSLADEADLVWDLREPVGAIELGMASDTELVTFVPDLVSFTAENDEKLLVLLPTGDELLIAESADAYRSNLFGGNPQGARDRVGEDLESVFH